MQFLLDENLPKADVLFSPFGQLNWFSGRVPPAALLREADVLLVRSITQVDEELLDKAPKLKFVGTATIGTEHIDIAELEKRGIGFASAPGSNAIAVGEYVLAAVLAINPEPRGLTAAIVGAGHTGKETARCLSAAGVRCAVYDPPLLQKNPDDPAFRDYRSIDFEQIFKQDIVSFHVPLTCEGKHSTRHLFDKSAIESLQAGTILVNASRGAVIDNQALLKRQQRSNDLKLALDVWENEPEILVPLVDYTAISTPHIAGHSIEGKIRGVYSLFRSASGHFGWSNGLSEASVLPNPEENAVMIRAEEPWPPLRQLVIGATQILDDTQRLRTNGLLPSGFDQIRRNRHGRREFSAYRVNGPERIGDQVSRLGFDFERSGKKSSNS